MNDDRNRSFLDQIADGLSPDPSARSASGDSIADTLSQSLANSITGNRPGADRFLFGSGSFADRLSQDLADAFFSEEE